MKERFLRSLGLVVPQIALGTVELGLPYGFGLDGQAQQPTFVQAERLLHAALDYGIRFIDTARAYGDSEEILGRCLAGRSAELVLATKASVRFEGASDAELAAELTRSVEESLSLLRTDHVDWLMLHSATLCDVEQVDRIAEPVKRLREQGKIRAFGASIYNDALAASLAAGIFECLQVAASAVDRRAEATVAGRGESRQDLVVRSVLLRGALTGKYKALPASMDLLRNAVARLEKISTDMGISLTEMAYRYAAGFDGLMLIGTAHVGELEEAVRFVECGPLPEDVLAAIRSEKELDDRFLNPARWPKPETEAA